MPDYDEGYRVGLGFLDHCYGGSAVLFPSKYQGHFFGLGEESSSVVRHEVEVVHPGCGGCFEDVTPRNKGK